VHKNAPRVSMQGIFYAQPKLKIVVKNGFLIPIIPDEIFTQILPCQEQASSYFTVDSGIHHLGHFMVKLFHSLSNSRLRVIAHVFQWHRKLFAHALPTALKKYSVVSVIFKLVD